ncbi:hypothetical protein HIM_08175 [Hirsutella minnesotensis 3608]|uniref:O-methylsterigmatocystin oxidoreductase n=1 Tax=Hirsutella minnesotensis 3608 TaxID=1043627 RepID=A0A0F7ZHE6_9HYPO|nr:hypothetical protein HIM_08175 [Hirsutella minnesotensis 3608]
MVQFLLFLGCLVAAVYLVRRCLQDARKHPRLPPGPTPLPILGSILDLPKAGEPEFRHWLKHRELYGPISSVVVLGRTYILLHDRQLAHQLLQKDSAKTTGRPWAEFAFSLCGLSDLMPVHNDSDFRLRRRLMHQQLGTAKLVARFDHVQEAEARWFLLRVLNNPDATIQHLKHTMGSIILKMTYGYAVGPKGADPLIDLIERMTENLVLATVPWPVDFIPALKHLPDGVPGSGFKTIARSWKKINQAVINIPYKFVRQQMAAGNHPPCYVSRLVHQFQRAEISSTLSCDDEAAIKRTAAAMYTGGADTTVTALTSFILAMMLFPEVQRKAQSAIDLLLRSQDRLPSLADQAQLPYIAAMVKEIFRWSPVAPLGIPHAASQDLVCGDYTIPEGAVLVPMVWWFLHDPAVYPEPDSFKPERFLEPHKEPDPTAVFGFGRRICPGRYFAEANVFLIAAQMLACFHIRKAVDESGIEIEPTLDVLPGLHTHLKEFPYRIEVRDTKRADLIRLVETEQPRRGGDGSLLDNDAIRACLERSG